MTVTLCEGSTTILVPASPSPAPPAAAACIRGLAADGAATAGCVFMCEWERDISDKEANGHLMTHTQGWMDLAHNLPYLDILLLMMGIYLWPFQDFHFAL